MRRATVHEQEDDALGARPEQRCVRGEGMKFGARRSGTQRRPETRQGDLPKAGTTLPQHLASANRRWQGVRHATGELGRIQHPFDSAGKGIEGES